MYNTTVAGDGDDGTLIAAAQRGERSAWDAIVRRHDRWVRGVVFSTLGATVHVDDVLQHIWTQVWQQIGTLADPSKWRSWLYRLARNAAIDLGEAAARRRKLHRPMADDFDPRGGDRAPDDQLVADEQHRRVLSAIQALPTIYREPFVLRHLENWNYEQIADTLGLPLDTVETRLVRARRLLRDALAERDAA